MWPLIVLTGEAHQTLPVALASLSREHVQDNELMMAGSVLTVLPVLALFLAVQRHYIEGLLAGSVKG
jgi:multiple sugar transport system permease protein